MKKIPSLFQRNYDGDRLVRDEITPGCEWVLTEACQATAKIDGTACMIRDGVMFKRYDRKKGKDAPPGWEPCEDAPNEHTGHWPGWVPVGDGPDDRWFREANTEIRADGTYELIGPKIQGNPYGLTEHKIVRHGFDHLFDVPTDFEGIRGWFELHPELEGIVWHHPDGRMAKIKRKDFGLAWPPTNATHGRR